MIEKIAVDQKNVLVAVVIGVGLSVSDGVTRAPTSADSTLLLTPAYANLRLK